MEGSCNEAAMKAHYYENMVAGASTYSKTFFVSETILKS